MKCTQVLFSGHAVRKMFERALSRDEVLAVVATGEVIADYPDDQPYPSVLLLGIVGSKPIHAVVASDPARGLCTVVTAYVPETALWSPDFKTRRR